MTDPNQQCKYLRAKNAYGSREGGTAPFLPINDGSTSYWCVCTASPVGPDNQPAYLENCDNHRPCYQALQADEI